MPLPECNAATDVGIRRADLKWCWFGHLVR